MVVVVVVVVVVVFMIFVVPTNGPVVLPTGVRSTCAVGECSS